MKGAIGAQRARVRLERPLRTGDDLGGGAIAWVDAGEVWAAVSAHGASLSVAFDTAPSLAGHALTINRRDDVRAGWRVVWGARAMRIVGVRDEGAARIDLICEEERL